MLSIDCSQMSCRSTVTLLAWAVMVSVVMHAPTVQGAEEASESQKQEKAAQDKETVETIAWRVDLETAKQEAIATGRPLLIEYTSKSCGWCRAMEKHTHPDPKVIATLNSQFIPVRVSGDPQKLRKANGVRGTPATLILDAPTMTQMLLVSGYRKPAPYLELMDIALKRREFFERNPAAFELFNQSVTAYANKQMHEAIELATQGLALLPQSTEILEQRGTSYYQLGKGKEAATDFGNAIVERSDYTELYLKRGLSHYLKGDYAAADADYRKALTLPSSYPYYIVSQRWFALCARGQHEQANALVREYVETHMPGSKEMWFNQLLLFQADMLSEERILKSARGAFPKMQLGRTLAMKAKLAGDDAAARAHLMKVRNIARLASYDHPAIMAELETLGEVKTSGRDHSGEIAE